MTTLLFDTLKLAEQLEAAGFSPQQAKGAAAALAQSISEQAVTREYLDLRLAELKADLLKWVISLLLGQTAVIAALVKLL
jgi:hypothetical protein